MIKAIVAVDKKWGIGKNNGLLFDIPEDMKYFRQKTSGTTVCMGYNTLLSFPGSKPLKNRTNIVLAPQGVVRDDCIVVYTLDDMLLKIKEQSDVFIIGGAMFYKTMLPYCDEVYVTKVDADGEATVFFENLDELNNFKMVEKSQPLNSNGFDICFTKYVNESPIK